MRVRNVFACFVAGILCVTTAIAQPGVRVLSGTSGSGPVRYGFKSADSSWAIAPVYEAAHVFVNGLAPVRKSGQWSFIRTDGSVARALPGWEDVGALHGGLAWARRGMEYGYIDSTGAVRIPVSFDAASDFNLYNVGAARVMPAGTFRYRTIDNPLLERAIAIGQRPLLIDARYNGRIDYQLGAAAYRRGDFAECRGLLIQSAATRNREALSLLGTCHYLGKGGSRDPDSAVHYWRMAAHRGEPNALFNMGLAAERGEGVARDYGLAAFYYGHAAAAGHIDALVNLGVLYSNGTGRPRDEAKAAALFEQAANAGSANGAFYLAQDIAYGRGRMLNKDEARQWFRIAAQRGHPDAVAASAAMDNPPVTGRYNKDFLKELDKPASNGGELNRPYNPDAMKPPSTSFTIPQPTYSERLQEASNRRYDAGVEKQLRDEERFNRQFRR